MDGRCEKPDLGSAAQSDRFKEAARALGCDKDEAAYNGKLGAIAWPKPHPAPEQPAARRGPKEPRRA